MVIAAASSFVQSGKVRLDELGGDHSAVGGNRSKPTEEFIKYI